MILNPPITDLLEKVDSRYTLVVLAAKRARQINDVRRSMPEPADDEKAVSVAVREIDNGKITYTREPEEQLSEVEQVLTDADAVAEDIEVPAADVEASDADKQD